MISIFKKLRPLNVLDQTWRRLFDARKEYFIYKDERIARFKHPYNVTWTSNRGFEIPIYMRFLDGIKQKDVLEFGNVLQHYVPLPHTVVDLNEKADGVINEDAEYFVPRKHYGAVISICTLEHVGVDCLRDENKAVRTLKKISQYGDRFMATWGIGYNPVLDEYALSTPYATKLKTNKKMTMIIYEVNNAQKISLCPSNGLLRLARARPGLRGK